MSFSDALDLLKNGESMTREGWNGAHSIALVLGGPDFTDRVFVIYTSRGEVMPWLASQADLLAEDWRVFDD